MPPELRLLKPDDTDPAPFAEFRNDARPSLWAAGAFALSALLLVALGFGERLDAKLAAFGAVPLLLLSLWLFAAGLSRRNVRYTLTAKRIELERGFLARRYESIELWRVRDVVLEQSLFERLRGVGRLTVYSSDQVEPALTIGPAPDAKALYEKLREAVSAARKDARVVPVDSGR